MFVKWSCGCKGMLIEDHCWVIDNCDKDPCGPYEPLAIYERNMTDRRSLLVGREERKNLTQEELDEEVMKTYEPLPYEEVETLLKEMNRLMQDGYGLRRVQSILKYEWPKE